MAVDHFPSTHATWLDAQLTIMETAGDGSPAGRGALDGLRRQLPSTSAAMRDGCRVFHPEMVPC